MAEILNLFNIFYCNFDVSVTMFIMGFTFLFQIPHLRPTEYKRSRLSRNRRTVNRAYGGVLSALAVRERFVCLFNL